MHQKLDEKLIQEKLKLIQETFKRVISKLKIKENSAIIGLVAVLLLIVVSISSIFYARSLRQEITRLKLLYEEQPMSPLNVFKPGTVGEIKVDSIVAGNETNNENIPVSAPLPSLIFSTAGIISAIKAESLIVRGDGSNFSDGIERILTVSYTPKTATFDLSGVKQKGPDGLKFLTVGDRILIEGAENVRGKTEFRAGIINVVKK